MIGYDEPIVNPHIAASRAASRVTACLVADVLGIPPEDVSADDLWHYGIGDMDAGASCVLWQPNRRPVVVHAVSLGGAYPLLAFPDPRDAQKGAGHDG